MAEQRVFRVALAPGTVVRQSGGHVYCYPGLYESDTAVLEIVIDAARPPDWPWPQVSENYLESEFGVSIEKPPYRKVFDG